MALFILGGFFTAHGKRLLLDLDLDLVVGETSDGHRNSIFVLGEPLDIVRRVSAFIGAAHADQEAGPCGRSRSLIDKAGQNQSVASHILHD